MLLGVERLMVDLRTVGQTVEGPFDSGNLRWLIVRSYPIPTGRFAGQVVNVAVPVPGDYPQTPPGGLYVNARLVPQAEMAGLHVHDRPETAQLPGEWQYWSRPIQEGWPGTNGAKRIITHWNGVMSRA